MDSSVNDFDLAVIPLTHSLRYPTFSTDSDCQLMKNGNHYRLYRLMGSHLREVAGVAGVNFALWAPNARNVSVVGDFNAWDGNANPMRLDPATGNWECFIPELQSGALYKYLVTFRNGHHVLKADPFGFRFEVPPKTASIVTSLDNYQWNDGKWMSRRQSNPNLLNQPISVYELHLGSWQQDPQFENGWLNYRELAKRVVEYCKPLGFTHIELLPISEHPYTGSWGYQTVGYFGATSRYGSPEDFMFFVDYCHQHELGVIIDWVPAHFPRDSHGLARFDGTALYEHEDPRKGQHPDWGTLIFNYGRHEVKDFLISNALFWLDKYHVDGLRVDAVASMLYLDYSRQEGQWVPNKYGGRENLEAIQFLKEFNIVVHREYPGALTIAEESTAWYGVSKPTYNGGLGFSLKWNMGWMNDTLSYMANNPIYRKFHQNTLTFSMVYAYSENFLLAFSHDEVVHGKRSLIDKMPGDEWQKFANLRLLYSYMWTHPGKKLLFMGSEFAQWREWNCDGPLDWNLLDYNLHQGVHKLVGDLNRLLRNEPALYEHDVDPSGFRWITCDDRANSVIAFLRYADDQADFLVVCCNFTPVIRAEYVIGVPAAGTYREIFNSDSEYYGGSNQGNGLGAIAEPIADDEAAQHAFAFQLHVTLPPLACVILKRSTTTRD
ncbi:MAG TPA: 1,4-alpha-glucan branching protein GlgB [Pirellulaceae bacterium]|nr:1,4-alpha-glucan branching protein GlgB [Pirellulaceae bacterium]HMO90583.1 1,4-alpha-glucan branching protein GlgB [Pirellulaceae bacterium]HMP67838.1 1,4-alpha-glucan branching protein GlgB [Pirellulaceae bacterium]